MPNREQLVKPIPPVFGIVMDKDGPIILWMMKGSIMKKVLALLLIGLMVILSGCDGSKKNGTDSKLSVSV
jgi:hypothetical protein